jgi:hypothetical protein
VLISNKISSVFLVLILYYCLSVLVFYLILFQTLYYTPELIWPPFCNYITIRMSPIQMYPEIVSYIKPCIVIVTLTVYWQVLYPTGHNFHGFDECKINWNWNRYTVMGHAPLTHPAVMRVWNSTVKTFKSTGMWHRVVRKSAAFRMIVVPSSSRKGSHRTGRH